jgi:hypothetical protein
MDVRLTLDMELQNQAHELLTGHSGALILLNAKTGEILVMASQPGFDPNQLDATWDELIQNPLAPLINRVTQGSYTTGDLANLSFMQAAADPSVDRIALRLPLADTAFPENATPLDVAFAAASLSNHGVRPAARLAFSYQHPENDWQLFPLLGKPAKLLSPAETKSQISNLQSPDISIWEIATVPTDEALTWYLAGTVNGERSTFTLLLVLEEENLPRAEEIGRLLIMDVIKRQ